MATKPKKKTVKKKRVSKDYKFTAIKKKAFTNALEQGHTRGAAAAAAGVTPNTVMKHKLKDLAFAEACEIAELAAIHLVENCLIANCKKGNAASIFFFLCNKAREKWQHVSHIVQDIKIDAKQTFEVSWGDRVGHLEKGQSQPKDKE